MTIVKYNGEKYKVEEQLTTASFKCESVDKFGNPSVSFKVTKYVSQSELKSEETKLKKNYDKVTMTFAHEITTLFREVVNKGNRNKDVKIVQVQRKYKNGSWNSVNPVQEENDLESSDSNWTTQTTIIFWSALVVAIACAWYLLRGLF